MEEARELLPEVLSITDLIVDERAALTEAVHAQRQGDAGTSLADLKAHEARLSELLDQLVDLGLEVKGFAPLLVDFPSMRDGHEVLLCLLEGERQLEWYHDAELGFAARRPID